MSHVAIAAALALDDVSAGERLAAFSLASYANREHRASPGTRIAAARAGLSRSQYLAARDSLQKRGLVVVEESGGGRGNSPVVALMFAQKGPWFDGQINAPLFEAVLGYSCSRGSARLLLGTLGAVADDELEVTGRTTDEIRAAAGMADSTYRRARAALLASGELVLERAGGGRARTNRWQLRDPRAADPLSAVAVRSRIAPSPTGRPLIATVKQAPGTEVRDGPASEVARERVKSPKSSGISVANPAQIRTVCGGKGPGLSGVSRRNPAQDRTVSAETPPQTPPPNARAGREPQNQGTCPPSPPEGGSRADSVTIVEDYLSDRGRTRQRTVVVDIDAIREQLSQPGEVDHADWECIRSELRQIVGESTFEIWLAPGELVATDSARCLLIACPPATRSWVAERFARVLERAGQLCGRDLRLASDRELQLLKAVIALGRDDSTAHTTPNFPHPIPHDHKEAV